MRVETEYAGTELATFGSVVTIVLAGVLPWASGTVGKPTASALALCCGLAAGAVLLYGDGTVTDDGVFLGLGVTVVLLAYRSFERFSGAEGVVGSPRAGMFLAALGGLALAAVGAHDCWTEIAVRSAGSTAESGEAAD